MGKQIYVAASFEMFRQVKKLHEHLQAIGHVITHDWTSLEHVSKLPPSIKRDKLAVEYAIQDTKGVEEADVFVLLLSKRKGTGSHIELGIAIGAQTPEIYIVGKDDGSQLFYWHPRVTHLKSIKELLALL